MLCGGCKKNRDGMKKVISFSLWGDQPRYTVGAVRNAELTPVFYPGWTARFYAGLSVPAEIVQRLLACGAEVVHMNEVGDWRGMFWRFAAASDTTVDVMISRDCDSRLSEREAAAVNEWLHSEAPFHIMRDHPAHRIPIPGGMWGVRAPLLRNMAGIISEYNLVDAWQVDQVFLRRIVYPVVRDVALIHDEFYEGQPFPVPRRGLEFVGEVFDEQDDPVSADRELLAQALTAGPLKRQLRRYRFRYGGWWAKVRDRRLIIGTH